MKRFKVLLNLAVFAIATIVCTTSCENTQKKEVLKVLSYNIKHGEGLDTILDLSRSAAIIKAQNPDLVGLQEIDHFCKRSDSIDQINYLENQTGLKGTFGAFMSYNGGFYGMGTLSSKEIVSTEILELPKALYEPRTAIVQVVKVGATEIVFANVHFDWVDSPEGSANRIEQAKALVTYINSLKKVVIITGDFNCTPDSPTMKYFEEQGFIFVEKGADNLSFQGMSKSEIDHLIYRDSEQVKFNPISVQLLEEPVVSDHRPLIVELEVIF